METNALSKTLTKQIPDRLVKSGKVTLAAGITLILSALPAAASATAFDQHISITGSATVSTSAAASSASQSGTLSDIIAGVGSHSTLNDTSITGGNPLSGTLSNIGDGFGVAFNISGSSAGGSAQSGNLFGDYQFNIANNSSTDSFTVNLKLAFSNVVNATNALTDPNNDGSYAISQIILNDTAGTPLFFEKLQSDTLGNFQYDMPLNSDNKNSGNGGQLSDIGSYQLSFTLAPGATINLGDTSPEFLVYGGSFGNGSFSVAASTFLSVASVVNLTTPVPLPPSILLFSFGLAALGLKGRRA